MDFSSPLAAMRPQPCTSWASHRDLPAPGSFYTGYGSMSFDFRTMSMHQKPSRQDYFTTRPLRGSSPTASLTADLDANFHIDKSPQAPTPRRSLFTTDLIKPRSERDHLDTPPIEIEPATTPPIPTSSPCIEGMDISPLPHKLPHFVAQITLPSPTPEESLELPVAEEVETPAIVLAPAPTTTPVPTFLPLPERRRSTTRPVLSRPKALSANNILPRAISAEVHLPPFRFGNVSLGSAACSAPPALENLLERPNDQLRTSHIGAMLPPPRRPTSGSSSRCNGSPSTGHVRKPSGGRPAFVRPQRKLMRRSLSMFQNPADVMKERELSFPLQQSALSPMAEAQQEHVLKLPHFLPEDEPDGLPRITPEIMASVLEGKYAGEFPQTRVIDCRFEYEFEGGHIAQAENFNDKDKLAANLFDGSMPANTLIIFHCEYSVHRAPLSAKFIRNHDRKINASNYPLLTHQEMYILDGGYKNFYEKFPEKCKGTYVEMSDERHELACERGMAKVKSQRQKLFRHSTYAFGDTHEMDVDESPTAAHRTMGPRSHSTFEIDTSPSFLSFHGAGVGSPFLASPLSKPFQRRMASY